MDNNNKGKPVSVMEIGYLFMENGLEVSSKNARGSVKTKKKG
jgi:hypothetical protein